jgi:hypothetical protein
MRRTLHVAALVFAFTFGGIALSDANPEPPTNGGSANGGGSSGQCTGANEDRPASCHNGNGSGN